MHPPWARGALKIPRLSGIPNPGESRPERLSLSLSSLVRYISPTSSDLLRHPRGVPLGSARLPLLRRLYAGCPRRRYSGFLLFPLSLSLSLSLSFSLFPSSLPVDDCRLPRPAREKGIKSHYGGRLAAAARAHRTRNKTARGFVVAAAASSLLARFAATSD